MVKLGADTVPSVRPAGVATRQKVGEGVGSCFQEQDERPPTPPEIHRFRKHMRAVPGEPVVHYGKAFDEPPPDIRFGYKSVSSGSTKESLSTAPKTDVEGFRRQQAEKAYSMNIREPLGHTIDRAYEWPQEILATGNGSPQNFPFGIKSKKSENAKSCLYPPEDPFVADNLDRHHALYRRTHGNYGAGEQKHREYDWQKAGIDPAVHSFGAKQQNATTNGVFQALHATEEPSGLGKTAVCDAKDAAFRSIRNSELGKPRRHGMAPVDPDLVFGAPSSKNPSAEPTAAACLQSSLAELERADFDLGRSVSRLSVGSRSSTASSRRYGLGREVTISDRAGGVPSVRSDIRKPRLRSVADNNNYGDETDASGVIFPNAYSGRGITANDFVDPRTPEHVSEIVKAALNVSDEEFAAVYEKASAAGWVLPDGRISVDAWRRMFGARN